MKTLASGLIISLALAAPVQAKQQTTAQLVLPTIPTASSEQAQKANIQLAARIFNRSRRVSRSGSSSRRRFTGASFRRAFRGSGFRNWTSNRKYNAARRARLQRRINRHRRRI